MTQREMKRLIAKECGCLQKEVSDDVFRYIMTNTRDVKDLVFSSCGSTKFVKFLYKSGADDCSRLNLDKFIY